MGEEGCYLSDGTQVMHIPAQKVAPPLDICGAGDASSAGIVLGLNPLNALVIGVLGLPGFVLLLLTQWVL